MSWTTESSLNRWQDKGLLTAEKAAELRAEVGEGNTNRGIRIFGAIGAVLVGLGIILFVSSNWDSMGPTARLSALVAAYAVAATGAMAAGRRNLPRVSEALWLTSTFVLGANIFLIAQIFHFQLTYWQGTLRWMIGALFLGWALRSRLQAVVAVPLGVLTLGWIGSSESWLLENQMATLFSPAGLEPILPLIGVGLISLSLVVARSKSWEFLQGSCFGWGVMLIVVTAIVSTTEPLVAKRFFRFDGTNTQIAILVGVALLLGAALVLGRFRWPASRLLLAVVASLSASMLLHVGGDPWIGLVSGEFHYLFAGYVVAAFVLTLWTIWAGVRASNVALVNIGMATSALIIVIQYFSWSFALLDRSMAFILGGLALLGLSVWMEKKRRSLLEEMQPVGGMSS